MKKSIRKKRIEKKKAGWYRYYLAVIINAKQKGIVLKKDDLPKFKIYDYNKVHISKPEISATLKFIIENPLSFAELTINDLPDEGYFYIPKIFSLSENPTETFNFLKQIFLSLYYDKYSRVVIDYKYCIYMDVDASVCMDVLLREFILFFDKCRRKGCQIKITEITPKNFEKDEIKKILFSIGSFKVLKNIELKFNGIITFPLLIGDNASKSKGSDKEVEVTKMVDYIINCLRKLNHILTWQAEDQLSKVIGEILINAGEHSHGPFRYSIGYFEENHNADTHVGVFRMTIFSFGNTIYQNFKNDNVKDLEVVKQMTELSNNYTVGNLFRFKSFEEETLWTLYALQEGVTSVKDKKRGNGSIQFIENFFSLKGNMEPDNMSSLVILSGNTRILFDGKYQIKELDRNGSTYKVMTFNKSGRFEDRPDEKYVTFADNFFPGTMIAAKININFNSIEKEVV